MQWREEDWIAQSSKKANSILWRAVEAQHVAATMSLVDSLDEQHVLEQILEANKPPIPPDYRQFDFLIFTPFRYTSAYASRFRRSDAPGIWYGAMDRQTACAEVGYWRWRFLMDSEGLKAGELRFESTLFQAKVLGRQIDLTKAPWKALSAQWRHSADYSSCQALADAARAQGLQWIQYGSARHPEGQCAAVLDAACLSLYEPNHQETWVCKITASTVIFRHRGDGFSFEPEVDTA
ncbi:RES family NAD+ phosphorylase [Rhodoferax sp.]|uniref:RES family NAD+ phosphorylase n=1 Tax=Rhodoferax sp. TaxID=50421 RepID=UPI001EB94971|nr:RES family NAD+ phosphorylase [Rhodoferax sp.]MBT9504962.1 RES family NAD+ phosphorylase [Rhodoferax sp.]